MDTRRLISALCYLSIFFAGFIIPLLVYLVTNEEEIRIHAKRAFLSHILPFFSLAVLLLFWLASPHLAGLFPIAAVTLLLYVIVIIWNVVKAAQVLAGRW
ncbi:DUF4870 domain-containing protein [Paenibacillus sp. P26]|nr:DUF4870 domain-containing protein [Paenibacillus sp. P26]UUZ89824.1 DUF4870 domain-containing protein [Paenibacillus sp. P25]